MKNLVEGVEAFFVWDKLALIQRNSTSVVNEPAETEGNPIVTGGVLEKHWRASAFNFFTGKWQTSDPLGYPDGWNNLAYVNNGVTDKGDIYGTFSIEGDNDFFNWVDHVFNTIDKALANGAIRSDAEKISALRDKYCFSIKQSEQFPQYNVLLGNLYIDNYNYLTREGKYFNAVDALLHELLHAIGYSHTVDDLDELLNELKTALPDLTNILDDFPPDGLRVEE